MEFDDELGKEKFADEFQIPGTEELKSLESWAHQHKLLLKAGRITHIVPPDIGEEERDEYMAKLEEKDATVDRYRAINEDTPI